MKYADAKKQADELTESALGELVNKLVKSKEYSKLLRELEAFQNDFKSGNLTFDECGSLIREKSLELDDSLCRDESGELDQELANTILDKVCEGLGISCYPIRGECTGNFIVFESYGNPTIVNYPPERGNYAVYSEELNLKINKIESEEHGLMLVEQAMRKHGVFGDVVNTDYHGNPSMVSIPDNIRNATDKQLQNMIDKIESEEDNE